MEEIKIRGKGMYSLWGRFEFETEEGNVRMDAKSALEIAYALFDWAGKDYDVLEEIEEEMEENKYD